MEFKLIEEQSLDPAAMDAALVKAVTAFADSIAYLEELRKERMAAHDPEALKDIIERYAIARNEAGFAARRVETAMAMRQPPILG